MPIDDVAAALDWHRTNIRSRRKRRSHAAKEQPPAPAAGASGNGESRPLKEGLRKLSF
jgi:hypothetical protein